MCSWRTFAGGRAGTSPSPGELWGQATRPWVPGLAAAPEGPQGSPPAGQGAGRGLAAPSLGLTPPVGPQAVLLFRALLLRDVLHDVPGGKCGAVGRGGPRALPPLWVTALRPPSSTCRHGWWGSGPGCCAPPSSSSSSPSPSTWATPGSLTTSTTGATCWQGCSRALSSPSSS